MRTIRIHWQVIWACMKKEIRSALTQKFSTIISVLLPVNFLILMSLFAISGGKGPIAVVMNDHGPYAQRFYAALDQARTFQLQQVSASAAQDLFQQEKVVAVLTIPADFDQRVQQQQSIQIPVTVNNVNSDFSNDIRRGVQLAITTFYSQVTPNQVNMAYTIQTLHTNTIGFLTYLAVSIVVIALTIGGLLQAGTPAAHEWEQGTIKELLLSPASSWAIALGKMLGAYVMSLLSGIIVLAIVMLLIRGVPIHWGEEIAVTALIIFIFVAWGTILGTLVKQSQAFTVLAFGTAVPMFFLSGGFGPLAFLGHNVIIDAIAYIFPDYYAIALQQHAFSDLNVAATGLGFNVFILVAYAIGLLLLATLILRRRVVSK